MNYINRISKKTWIVIAIVIIAIILITLLSGAKRKTEFTTAEFQQQIENSADLKEVINSKRNNFKSGGYTLDTKLSKIDWKYGSESGTLAVDDGSLNVFATGRIEGFKVNFNSGDLKFMENDSKALFFSPLVTPNTKDDAFTISLTITAAGKTISTSVGMFAKKTDSGISISGDVTLDPKVSLGQAESTANLIISPTFVFK